MTVKKRRDNMDITQLIKKSWKTFWGWFEAVDDIDQKSDRPVADSTEITKHGNPYFDFKCPRCGCEFKTKITECKTRELQSERNISGTDTWIPEVIVDYYTSCPECQFKCWNDGKAKPKSNHLGCRTPDMGE
jgi:hypothetical protein